MAPDVGERDPVHMPMTFHSRPQRARPRHVRGPLSRKRNPAGPDAPTVFNRRTSREITDPLRTSTGHLLICPVLLSVAPDSAFVSADCGRHLAQVVAELVIAAG